MVDIDEIVVMVKIEAEYVLRLKDIYARNARKGLRERKHFSNYIQSNFKNTRTDVFWLREFPPKFTTI